MNRLDERAAVVSSGAASIGRSVSERSVEEGASVFIFGRKQDALVAAVVELEPNARAVKSSVSDLADPDRLYATAKAERGTVDIDFGNAETASQLKQGEITAEYNDGTFDVNAKGEMHTIRRELPLMCERGSIIKGKTGRFAFG